MIPDSREIIDLIKTSKKISLTFFLKPYAYTLFNKSIVLF